MISENAGYDKPAFECLATRYLSGESTSAEREQLVALLNNPEWKELFDNMQLAWELPVPHFDSHAASKRLAQRIKERAVDNSDHPKQARPPANTGKREQKLRANPLFRTASLLAATLFLIAGVCLTAMFRASRSASHFAVASSSSFATKDENLMESATNARERTMLMLPDGTRVTLNSGGSLSYPAAFSPGTRIVHLKGEAFFDVAHDPDAPFVVETATMRITVLGTQFNVRDFADNNEPEVSLLKGKVQITELNPAGKSAPVTLLPGQQYTLTAAARNERVRTIQPETIAQWRHDTSLVFDREPLVSVIRKLEARFGITIELAQAGLGQETITGRFDRESLEQILNMLKQTGEIDYQVIEDGHHPGKVIISPAKNR
ncbi:hypothetical protein AW736_09795 [Termitidicoccus mucosus]|uniref:FecR protein domain-containing protein n=2 Tax=Termitidicoccus mucosus TaxID=1184151 RepID=A0A178IJL8_9BACT|nr:hypothetical protein AW736_09795 [Opitutaceae bacterium TSB47]